jgi:hypothetical protein
MKTRRRRNKKRATRRKGGMFAAKSAAKRAASTVGSLSKTLFSEVGKAKAQDAFKDQVKSWENSVNNKENQENIKINNNKPVNSQLYNYQNQL